MSGNFASDYIDVATRIGEFRKKYPDGSLQVLDPHTPYRMLEIDGATFVVVVAAAYRNPDDPRPGIGMAQEQIPGRTPYTKGSELQNAETSAWGRAIVAALAADTKKGVASADEVRNRRAEQEAEPIAVRDPGRSRGKTQRSKPEGPTDDPWTAPLERTTDVEWFADVQARLDLCGTPGEVRGLIDEARAKWHEGKLSDADSVIWKQATEARLTELGAAS